MENRETRIKLILIAIIIFILIWDAKAQDVHFSQPYAAPLYLNPAFAGVVKHSRVTANARQQWAGTPANYMSSTFSYDRNIPHLKSGIGFLGTIDQAGTGNLKNMTAGIIYAYQLNVHQNKWVVRSGLNFSGASTSVDYQKLTFGDQLTIDGKVFETTSDIQNVRRNNYFDISSGVLAYSKHIWVGGSARHLNEPNQALAGQYSNIPILVSLHGGAKIPLVTSYLVKKEIDLLPTFQYKAQGKYDQVDAGLYLYYQPMILGIWYRGLPGIKHYDKGFPNHDALALLVGYKYETFKIGYSYDITVSNLTTSTAGAHEISVSYEFDYDIKRKKPRRKDMRVTCPIPQL